MVWNLSSWSSVMQPFSFSSVRIHLSWRRLALEKKKWRRSTREDVMASGVAAAAAAGVVGVSSAILDCFMHKRFGNDWWMERRMASSVEL